MNESKKLDAGDMQEEMEIKMSTAWQESELCCPKCGSKISGGMCLSLDCLYKKEVTR